jgi:N-acetylmuramoyl-L-alanine amidase
MSHALASRVIVVDPATAAPTRVWVEKRRPGEGNNLAVSKRLADNLAQAGAMVLLTRESDSDLSDRYSRSDGKKEGGPGKAGSYRQR